MASQTTSRARSAGVVCFLAAALALCWATALLLAGGFDFTLFGSHVRTHEPFRPFMAGAVALAAGVWFYGVDRVHEMW
jgi:hypothetical protein